MDNEQDHIVFSKTAKQTHQLLKAGKLKKTNKKTIKLSPKTKHKNNIARAKGAACWNLKQCLIIVVNTAEAKS